MSSNELSNLNKVENPIISLSISETKFSYKILDFENLSSLSKSELKIFFLSDIYFLSVAQILSI